MSQCIIVLPSLSLARRTKNREMVGFSVKERVSKFTGQKSKKVCMWACVRKTVRVTVPLMKCGEDPENLLNVCICL